MKKLLVILLIFLSIELVYAENYFTSSYMDVNLNILGDYIVKKQADSELKSVKVNISFFPREDYRQNIRSLLTVPDANINNDAVNFNWVNPTMSDNSFRINSDLRVEFKRKKIRDKISFPLKGIPSDIERYTKPSDTADSDNEKIMRTANLIAQGEDDLFVVAFKLAEWTKNNVKYDLITATESASKPASWVLENKIGVCDEISNLFIAMCRSIGIPARFVSGVAYTNSDLFAERWGPHGWAEVYFPDYGWVEFDVTYGQLGYIDPTHIKLKESLDATEPSTRYSWTGYNTNLETNKLDIDVDVTNAGDPIDNNIEFNAYSEKSETSLNSYNIINLHVKNNNNYYVAEQFTFYHPKEIKMEDPESKDVLLLPGGEADLYWIISLNGLNDNFVYSFPMAVSDLENATVNFEFTASREAPLFSRTEALKLIDSKREQVQKIYSKNLKLDCKPNKGTLRVGDSTKVICSISNSGNIYFENLSVCMDSCQEIELGINQKKQLEFTLKDDAAGTKEKSVIAKGRDAVQASTFSYTIFDAPKIEIEEIKYPQDINYHDSYTMSFLLKKVSFAKPLNITVTLDQEGYKKSWSLDELSENRNFLIDLKGSDLFDKENNFILSVEYLDDLGNSYEENADLKILLNDVTFIQKISMKFHKFALGLLTIKGVVEFILIIIIVFAATFFLIFKGRKNAKI